MELLTAWMKCNVGKTRVRKMIRIGLIGSGKMAQHYIRALRNLDISGLVIVNLSSRAEIVKQHVFQELGSGTIFREAERIEDVLSNTDAIIVATNVSKVKGFYCKIEGSRKPALIEKPGFSSLAEFDQFHSRLRDNNSIYFALNRRFYIGVQKAKETLTANRLNLIGADLFFSDIINAKYIQRHFGRDCLESRILNTTFHWFDLINFLFDNPTVEKVAACDERVIVEYSSEKMHFYLQVVYNAPVHHRVNIFFTSSKCICLSPIESFKSFNNLNSIKKTRFGYEFHPDHSWEETDRSKPGLESMVAEFLRRTDCIDVPCMPATSDLPNFKSIAKNFEDIRKVLESIK